MCIIWTDGPDMTALAREWLKDFYRYNPDGLGVMYVEGNELIVERTVGTLGEQIDLYNRIRALGKNVIFHIRRQTHGDKSLEMCHPYEVFGENRPHPTIPDYQMQLMHNGVLATGNAKGTDKSDTWWFIEDYFRPLVEADPIGFFENTVLHKILGNFIGNNRFAIMDNRGNQVIINQDQGVFWDGRWMSNTYAWDAVKAGVVKPRLPAVGGRWGKGVSLWDPWDSQGGNLNYESSWDIEEEVDIEVGLFDLVYEWEPILYPEMEFVDNRVEFGPVNLHEIEKGGEARVAWVALTLDWAGEDKLLKKLTYSTLYKFVESLTTEGLMRFVEEVEDGVYDTEDILEYINAYMD